MAGVNEKYFKFFRLKENKTKTEVRGPLQNQVKTEIIIMTEENYYAGETDSETPTKFKTDKKVSYVKIYNDRFCC